MLELCSFCTQDLKRALLWVSDEAEVEFLGESAPVFWHLFEVHDLSSADLSVHVCQDTKNVFLSVRTQ